MGQKKTKKQPETPISLGERMRRIQELEEWKPPFWIYCKMPGFQISGGRICLDINSDGDSMSREEALRFFELLVEELSV
jgi:hypothetical protein